VYVTSTDSVATLLHAIRVVPAARDWLVRGVAVTIHPRCAERLREAGFECVDITGADDELVAACVKRHLAGNLSLSAW
jgi:uroporphyrinogen-III synthase